jgi:ribose-phosphate pyrophosphokinase
VYRRPELAEKPWFVEVDMSKYVSYIIETLNHDTTISELLDPVDKIKALMEKHKADLAAQSK